MIPTAQVVLFPFFFVTDALMQFQEQMGGEADKADLLSEEDVAEWIMIIRKICLVWQNILYTLF